MLGIVGKHGRLGEEGKRSLTSEKRKTENLRNVVD